jgi:flotillin
MFGYRVPAPDEAMLISGGKQKADEGGQFRIVTGHGAWVMPFFRKVRFLSLEVHTVDFSEKCYTNHGITVNVSAVVAFKVDNHPNAITAAAQRFLNDQKKGQMEELTRKIFVGHLRGIVGRMTVEEIIQNREKLTEEVLTGSQSEMSNMGLHVDSLQIETFDDADGSYITDMAKPQRAAIDQAAKVAQAKADQAAQAAQQESERAQAQQARDTEIARAQYKAEVDKAEQEAAQAGPLAQAEAQQKVIEMQRELAERNAELRERQLVAEVIKPAEAERQRLRIVAEGQAQAAEQQAHQAEWQATGQAKQIKLNAEATAEARVKTATAEAEAARLQGAADGEAETARAAGVRATRLAEAEGARALADANAANDSVQLRLKEIEIQPAIAQAIADGLNLGGANLTILNGAEGLTQMLASVVPLVKGVMESFRSPIEEYKGVPDSPATLAANGMPSTPATQK